MKKSLFQTPFHRGIMRAHSHGEHEHSLRQELICHFPYATLSVAVSFVALGLLQFISAGIAADTYQMQSSYHQLFHLLHYVHLLFASLGTVTTFLRFSSQLGRCMVFSLLSPALFCTLSDVALPAIAGNILGMDVDLHICFFSLPDLMNVIPFMMIGVLTGFVIAFHNTSGLHQFALRSHFIHILISSLAASSYVMSYGFHEWHAVMGLLFCFLVAAVVVPCTISDVVVPMYVARWRMSPHEKHTH